tara:strand:- start:4 stop:543 length:540 start_codon:yes stop_codon:yes gene_type:complete
MNIENNSSNEEFLKIGVSNNPFKRANNIIIQSKGIYNAYPIARKTIENDIYETNRSASLAYKEEFEIKKFIKNNGIKYRPEIYFPGRGECLSKNAKNEIISKFNLIEYGELNEIFIARQYVIVKTKFGIWKIGKNTFNQKKGVLGILSRERRKKGINNSLIKFYNEVDTSVRFVPPFSE